MSLSLGVCFGLWLLQAPATNPVQPQAVSCIQTVSLPPCEPEDWHTVGTDMAPYWTGTCTRDEINNLHGKSDNSIRVEHIVWLGTPRAETTRCGWMKFNTAAIPDSAVILAARVRYHVYYWEMSFSFRFTALDVDPVGTDARSLYAAIGNGTVCADLPMGRLWDTTDLNAAGVQHVQNSLSRDWVAFGLWGYGWSSILTKRAWIIGWNNNPRADSPWLDVDYSVTALAEPQEAQRPAGLSLPTVLRGVLNLQSANCNLRSKTTLLDASGRKVTELQAGANDVRQLAPGVYFVQTTEGSRLAASAKVVMQKE